jgi:hypothetical protein
MDSGHFWPLKRKKGLNLVSNFELNLSSPSGGVEIQSALLAIADFTCNLAFSALF